MKFIIDLIEDVKEQIGNHEAYAVTAGLLRIDSNNSTKLNYAGEAPISQFTINDTVKELQFKIDTNVASMTIGALIPSLLILDMDSMMYALKIDVNAQYRDMEIVGFGKNDEEKKYILFIKI